MACDASFSVVGAALDQHTKKRLDGKSYESNFLFFFFEKGTY